MKIGTLLVVVHESGLRFFVIKPAPVRGPPGTAHLTWHLGSAGQGGQPPTVTACRVQIQVAPAAGLTCLSMQFRLQLHCADPTVSDV